MVKLSSRTLWISALAAFIVVAQVGSTPSRSDDLRVALRSECPVERGELESDQSVADVIAGALKPIEIPVLKAAAGIASAYGRSHVSVPRVGATAVHLHISNLDGQWIVNRRIWRCLVIAVVDLRASARSSQEGDVVDDPTAGTRVYLEARIDVAADGTAITLTPVFLKFGAPADSSILGSRARDLRFDLQFSVPGAEGPFARAVLEMAAMVPVDSGFSLAASNSVLPRKGSGWIPIPPPPPPPVAVSSATKGGGLGARAGGNGVAKVHLRTPVTIGVSVTETRQASLLWQLLGQALEATALARTGDSGA